MMETGREIDLPQAIIDIGRRNCPADRKGRLRRLMWEAVEKHIPDIILLPESRKYIFGDLEQHAKHGKFQYSVFAILMGIFQGRKTWVIDSDEYITSEAAEICCHLHNNYVFYRRFVGEAAGYPEPSDYIRVKGEAPTYMGPLDHMMVRTDRIDQIYKFDFFDMSPAAIIDRAGKNVRNQKDRRRRAEERYRSLQQKAESRPFVTTTRLLSKKRDSRYYEKMVIKLMQQGYKTLEIARKLDISDRGVRKIKKRLQERHEKG
jgi:hypothetical protein